MIYGFIHIQLWIFGGSIAETTGKPFRVNNVLKGKVWPVVKGNVCGMKMRVQKKVFH